MTARQPHSTPRCEVSNEEYHTRGPRKVCSSISSNSSCGSYRIPLALRMIAAPSPCPVALLPLRPIICCACQTHPQYLFEMERIYLSEQQQHDRTQRVRIASNFSIIKTTPQHLQSIDIGLDLFWCSISPPSRVPHVGQCKRSSSSVQSGILAKATRYILYEITKSPGEIVPQIRVLSQMHLVDQGHS